MNKTLSLSVIAAVVIGLSGCASSAAPTQAASPEASSTPYGTAISAQPLLDKAETTILGQPLVYPTELPAQLSSSIITIPPGVETGLHKHDAPMYAYVIEGTLTVTYDGGVIKTYKPGDALIEAVGTPHNGVNAGTTPVKVLVVNVGAESVANTVPLP